MDKLLYTIDDLIAIASVSRTKIYDEMKAGRLRPVRIGTAIRFKRADLNEWVESLTEQAG